MSADTTNSVDEADRERMNLPSGSFLPRLRFCNGSWNKAKSIPYARRQEIQNKAYDAAQGRRLHKYIEYYLKHQQAPPDITPKDEDLCDTTYNLLQSAREQTGFYALDDTESWQETRLPLRNHMLDIVSTGQFDFLEICKRLAMCLIGDWKTLWNEHTAPQFNYQLIQYACEVMQKYPWMEIFYLVLIQPNMREDKRLQIARFTRSQLEYYVEEIFEIYETATNPDAPRVPGPFQCETCPSRFNCSEALAAALALQSPHFLDVEGVDPQKLHAIRKAKKLIGEVCSDYEDRAIRMLRVDDESVPGFAITQGSKQTKVTCSLQAWARLKPILTGQEYSSGCTASVSLLSDVLFLKRKAENKKITKERSREIIEENLGDLVVTTRKKDSLKEK